ncbi:MAG: ATP-binding protein [Rickettsiales bacterium]
MILKNQILATQAPLGVVVIIVSLMVFLSFNTIGVHTNTILISNYKSLIAMQEMRKATDNIDEVLWKAVRGEIPKSDLEFEISQYIQNFNKQLDIQKGNMSISGEEEVTSTLDGKWLIVATSLQAFPTRQIDYKNSYETTLHAQLIDVKASIALLSDLNQDDIFYQTEEITLMIKHMSKVVLLITLLAFFVGLLISSTWINRILRPLSQLTQLIRQASEGKLGTKLDIRGNDEVAALGKEFNTLTTNIESYRNSTVGHVIQTQLFMQAAIDSYPDPILILDKELKTLHVNRAAVEFFEFDNSKNYLEGFLSILPENLRSRVENLAQMILADPHENLPDALTGALLVQIADKRYEFIVGARPVHETLKGVIGIAVIMRNITNLNVKGYIKTENISNMMHTLLQPLNSVHIAIHSCLDQKIGMLNEKQEEVLSYARNDCFRLRRNLVNLQDLNYIETTQFSVLHKLNLVEIIQEVIDSFEALASTQDIVLDAEFDGAESNIYANDYQIKLVLENLIDNAISHSNPGYQVSIRLHDLPKKVKFLIHNGGTVIPAEYKRKIFDKFFQLPDDNSSKDGLGLYICKTIVENYGGKIGVKSLEGFGTSFWFTLPKSE